MSVSSRQIRLAQASTRIGGVSWSFRISVPSTSKSAWADLNSAVFQRVDLLMADSSIAPASN
jgi:hypothetical protein